MNKQPTPTPPAVTPYDQDRTYTRFYKTLLILSTIGTAFGLIGIVTTVPEIFKYLVSTPVYAYAQLASIVVTIGATVALVLLWLKRPFGLWLKLSSYAFGLIIVVVLGLSTGPILADNVTQLVSQTPSLSRATADTLMRVTLYGALVLSAISEITFAILWWFAWKGQVKADTK